MAQASSLWSAGREACAWSLYMPNATWCHPEPEAKDLAAASFAAVICLVTHAIADQANREVRSALREILRLRLRMTLTALRPSFTGERLCWTDVPACR